jgi:thiol-disulfide isomerase/thioredoxin
MDKTIKIGVVVLTIFAIAGVAVLFSGILSQKGPVDGSPVTVYFFYGEECPHCHNIMPLINNLTQKYPQVDFQVLEVWHNQTNYKVYAGINTQAGLTSFSVPEAVVGNTILIGENDIPLGLEEVLQEELKKKV